MKTWTIHRKGLSFRVYIHIGGDCTVSDKYIIGVFDFDGTTVADSDTIQFLRQAEAHDHVDVLTQDLPRSFIVTLDRIYYSPIAAATLRRRLERRFVSSQHDIWQQDDTPVRYD